MAIAGREGIEEEDFVAMLIEHDVSKEEGKELFRLLNGDEDNLLNLSEFLIASIILSRGGSKKERMLLAFDVLDENQNGSLSLEELRPYFLAAFSLLFFAGYIQREEMQRMAEEAIEDGIRNHSGADKALSFEEFYRWIEGEEEGVERAKKEEEREKEAGVDTSAESIAIEGPHSPSERLRVKRRKERKKERIIMIA